LLAPPTKMTYEGFVLAKETRTSPGGGEGLMRAPPANRRTIVIEAYVRLSSRLMRSRHLEMLCAL
jgi:hypothetical protein